MSLRPRWLAAAAAAVFGVLVLAGPAPAAFVYYTSSAPAVFPPDPYTPPDRTAFDAATTNQSIETFEGLAGYDGSTIAGPISANGSPPYPIIPNLVIDTGVVGGGDFYVTTDTYPFGPTTVLTTNAIPAPDVYAVLTFATPVTAFGVDLTVSDGQSGTYTISIYDAMGNLLDVPYTISPLPSPPAAPDAVDVWFFGVVSTDPNLQIGRVVLDAEIFETFDNVTLATAFNPVGVPAPGGLALLLAAGPVGLLLRRRKAA